MARTKSSETENSDDEVILRVKKSSVDSGVSSKDASSSSDSSDLTKIKKIFFIKSYSLEEKPSEQAKTIDDPLQKDQIEIWRSNGATITVPRIEEDPECSESNTLRPKSLQNSMRRESFLRQSFQNIFRRGFGRYSTQKLVSRSSSSSSSSEIKSLSRRFNRASSSSSSHSDGGGACGSDVLMRGEGNEELNCFVKVKDEELGILRFIRTGSISTSTRRRSTSSVSFGIRSAPNSPMAPLQGQSEVHGQSVINLSTITRSPSHNTSNKLDSKSLRQLSPPIPVAASARSISPHPKSSSSSSVSKNEIPEKEKKRKELSSSRQKKFHRHFQQVSKDERVLNYFSCALVSDILLQGHLYITDNYFAFYSNVFGFVTKLLIPTASVIKISKEKTAKIIPNAVGVATVDERHVFGSFMSREAAFRLMCSVCPPLEPIEIIPKVPDVEVSEEYSVEDDSSCSISGNESPPQVQDSTSDASQTVRQRAVPIIAPAAAAVDVVDGKNIPDKAKLVPTQSPCSSSTPVKQQQSSKSPPPRIVSSRTIKFKFPTDLHVVYIGVILSMVLALLSGFLLYRILDIEAKTNYKSSLEFNWGSGNDVEVYAEALKWQKEMQTKSTEEAQIILNTNLEQIARVRKSLETLSLLIHDKNPLSSQFESGGEDNRGFVSDENSSIDRGETT